MSMKIERNSFKDCKGNLFQVTVLTVGGKRPGPVITIIAGQHGMEHSGPCFLPELAEELDRTDFAGTVHICPCANPGALAMDYEFYPEREDLSLIKDYYYSIFRHEYSPWGLGRKDGVKNDYNMNRLWNRTGKGIAFEITSWLWKNYVEPANLTLDLHCAQVSRPYIYNDFPKNDPLIAVTGIELSIPEYRKKSLANTLNYQAARREGRYAFCIEFSIQHGLREHEYPIGKNAVRNLMIKMGMLKAEPVPGPHPTYSLPEEQTEKNSRCVMSSNFGHIRYFFDDCKPVKKGDLLYEIRDIQTLKILERGFAPFDGIIWNKTFKPLAEPGLRLFNFYQVTELKADFRTLIC